MPAARRKAKQSRRGHWKRSNASTYCSKSSIPNHGLRLFEGKPQLVHYHPRPRQRLTCTSMTANEDDEMSGAGEFHPGYLRNGRTTEKWSKVMEQPKSKWNDPASGAINRERRTPIAPTSAPGQMRGGRTPDSNFGGHDPALVDD
jgi:hypothetical protein